MDKQNVTSKYNGILFSLRKEGNSDMCDNMDEPLRHVKCPVLSEKGLDVWSLDPGWNPGSAPV